MMKRQPSQEQMSRKEGGRPRKEESPPSLPSSGPHVCHVRGSVSHTPARLEPHSPLSRPGRAHFHAPVGAGPQLATPPPAAASPVRGRSTSTPPASAPASSLSSPACGAEAKSFPGAPSPALKGRRREELRPQQPGLLLPPPQLPLPFLPLGCRSPVRRARQRGLPRASR